MDENRFSPKLREIKMQDLWDKEKVPEFKDFLVEIDESLLKEIGQSDDLMRWYDFYNSPEKPLNPREFLHYWSFLTEEERLLHMLFSPADMLIELRRE